MPSGVSVDPDDLRERIERLCMATTLEETPWGSLSWFARRCEVTPAAVSEWCQGRSGIDPRHIETLQRLEERVGIG